jgi:hypothetical protein
MAPGSTRDFITLAVAAVAVEVRLPERADAPTVCAGPIDVLPIHGDAVSRGTKPNFITTDEIGRAGLAVDGRHIYWADPGNGTIGRANLDGICIDGQVVSVCSGFPMRGRGSPSTGCR